jgi:hypothetical protein
MKLGQIAGIVIGIGCALALSTFTDLSVAASNSIGLTIGIGTAIGLSRAAN